MKKNSVMRHYRRWLKKLELRGLNVHEPHVRQVAMLNATLDAGRGLGLMKLRMKQQPDFSEAIKAAGKLVEHLGKDGYCDDWTEDREKEVYQAFMTCLYGDEFWHWYNAIVTGE